MKEGKGEKEHVGLLELIEESRSKPLAMAHVRDGMLAWKRSKQSWL